MFYHLKRVLSFEGMHFPNPDLERIYAEARQRCYTPPFAMSLDNDVLLTHYTLPGKQRLYVAAVTAIAQSPSTVTRGTASPSAPVSPPAIEQRDTGRRHYRPLPQRVIEVLTLLFTLIVNGHQTMYIWPDLLFDLLSERTSTIPYCPYALYIPPYHDLLSESPPQPDRGRPRSHLQSSHGPAGQGGIDKESREIPDYVYGATIGQDDRAEECSTRLKEDIMLDACVV